MIRKILRNDGKIDDAKLDGKRLAPHIYINEIDDEGNFIIAEKLVEVFEEIRNRIGAQLLITSGYRSPEKQKRLREYYTSKGMPNHASVRSPHSEGMALDISCNDKAAVGNLMAVVKDIRDHGKPYIRIGWKQYLEEGCHFVHIDVCPFFFHPKDGIMKTAEVPEAWRQYFCEW